MARAIGDNESGGPGQLRLGVCDVGERGADVPIERVHRVMVVMLIVTLRADLL